MADPKPWIGPDDVIDAVSSWTGIRRQDLVKPGGTKRVVKAKRLLAHVLRHGFSLSLREVGEAMGYFGQYAHTSAHHLLSTGDVDVAEVALITTTLRSTE